MLLTKDICCGYVGNLTATDKELLTAVLADVPELGKQFMQFSRTKLSIGYDIGTYFYFEFYVDYTKVTVACSDWRKNPLGFRLMYEDFETAAALLEAGLKRLVDTYQKPASVGNVKAFYEKAKTLWAWKRPGSASYTMIDGEAFLSEYDARFVTVFVSETETQNILASSDTYEFTNGSYYLKSILVPVYNNSIPFDIIKRRVVASAAELYEFVMVDGERRYIDVRKSITKLFSVPIHPYTTRVETLVPVEKLFLSGKADLYAKRPQEETPFLGWELEACVPKDAPVEPAATVFKKYLPNLVMCKHDGSITPAGFETVSVPATLDFWKESGLASTLDSMRAAPYSMRSFEHKSCGFHVHVSRSALSVLDLQKMERFMHNPDNLEFITSVAGRPPNNYQSYNQKMFSDRASLLPSAVRSGGVSRRTEENLSYFCSVDFFKDHLAAELVSSVFSDKLERLFDVFERDVGFNSLSVVASTPSTFLNSTEIETLLHHVEQNENDVFSYLYNYFRNSSQGYGQRIVGSTFRGPSLRVEVERITTILLRNVCTHCPTFKEAVSPYFPEWGFTLYEEQRQPTPTTPLWKTNVRRSKLLYGRKDSYMAALATPGPVGKHVLGRFDVLNTNNKNTVEFRLFKGTLSPTSIMRYLEFVDALVRFAAATSATNSGVHYEAFLKWLFSDTFNSLRYEHLVSFCINKKFISRTAVRRKSLPKLVEKDKEGASLLKARVFEEAEMQMQQPLGVFTTNPDAAQLDPMVGVEQSCEAVDLFEEDSDEDEGDGEELCYCPECQESRGEI